MHADSSRDAPDFWPGYVDALINVVLNLLFVVSIFAMAIAATSLLPRLAARSADSAHAGDTVGSDELPELAARPSATPSPAPAHGKVLATAAANAASASASASGSASTSTSTATAAMTSDRRGDLSPSPEPRLDLRLSVRATTPREVASPVRVEQVETDEGVRIRVSFAAGMASLDDAARQRLQALAGSALADRALTLWAATDLRQATARRAASLRLMALRDELSRAGLPADRIDLKVTGGGVWPESGPTTVWLSGVASTDGAH